jgi:hypothetical protein
MTVYGQYMRCVVEFSNQAWPNMLNVMNFRLPTAASFAAAHAAIISEIEDAFVAHLDGDVATAVTMETIESTDMRAADGPQLVANVGVAGLNGTNRLPPGTALCVSLRTGLTGRSNRGRTYLGGFCEDVNDSEGQPQANLVSHCESYITDIITGSDAAGYPLAVVSTILNNEPRATAKVTDVETAVADRVWDRQKRRGRAA